MAAPLTEAHLNEPITRHLRQDFARLGVGQTVGEALAGLRQHPPRGRIIYFYVTDPDGRLAGVVPTRRLLLSAPDTPLADIMISRVIALPDSATVLDACEFFTLHRLLAFPVVAEDRRVVGVVDVELYTDELSGLEDRGGDDDRERAHDLFQLVGVHLAEARQGSPLASFRRRFPWLLCSVAGGILAAVLSAAYRDELQRVVALALFLPVVLGLAESVGIQSIGLALQTLHGRAPTWPSLVRRSGRELLTGACLGAAAGLIVAAVAAGWLGQPRVVLCLLGGVAGGVASAAVLGWAMPNLLRLLRLDPRVAAGPVALTAADVITLLVYLNLARWLLG
jgi:magnesium transporter